MVVSPTAVSLPHRLARASGATGRRAGWTLALVLALLVLSVAPSRAQTMVCAGQTGQAVLQCIQNGYSPTGTLGYGPARDVMYRDIDARPSGELEGICSGYTITLTPGADPSQDAFAKGINAEHVFPQSRGAGTEP